MVTTAIIVYIIGCILALGRANAIVNSHLRFWMERKSDYIGFVMIFAAASWVGFVILLYVYIVIEYNERGTPFLDFKIKP